MRKKERKKMPEFPKEMDDFEPPTNHIVGVKYPTIPINQLGH